MLLWQQLRKNEPSDYLRLLSTTFIREQGALMIMTEVVVVIVKAPLEIIICAVVTILHLSHLVCILQC